MPRLAFWSKGKLLGQPGDKEAASAAVREGRGNQRTSRGEQAAKRFAWRSLLQTQTDPVDPIVAGGLVALMAFGVVMSYSASAVFAFQHFGDGQYFLVRQASFAVVGLAFMWGISRIDYHRLRRLTYPMLAGVLVLMLFVASGWGRRVGGAARWIPLGPINVQPAELAKVVLILWLAYSLSKKAERIRTFSIGFLPHVLMAGLLIVLCLRQPDFGSAVMIALITFVLLFTAGAKTGYTLGAGLLATPIAYYLIAGSEYRMRRIQAFLAPFEHRYDEGYQIAESLMSFGTGGLTGIGLGDSRQKLFFLPEAHTDFIAAIIGEELGFAGIAALIGAFSVLTIRGLYIGSNAPDDYGAYLAVGISLFIGLQAFTNMAVATGLLPTKGLVLPFVSYGGSALLSNSFAAGVLLSVSRVRAVRGQIKAKSERVPRQASAKGAT